MLNLYNNTLSGSVTNLTHDKYLRVFENFLYFGLFLPFQGLAAPEAHKDIEFSLNLIIKPKVFRLQINVVEKVLNFLLWIDLHDDVLA
jgi:hypothetical protein